MFSKSSLVGLNFHEDEGLSFVGLYNICKYIARCYKFIISKKLRLFDSEQTEESIYFILYLFLHFYQILFHEANLH